MQQVDQAPRTRPSQLETFVTLTAWIPAAALLAGWVWWMTVNGGYFGRDWYPVAIALVCFAGVAAAGGWSLPGSRSGRAALALLAAFVGWSLLSLLWADSPGRAWDSSDKLLLVLAGATILALAPWTPRSATFYFGLFAAAVAAACAVTLVDAVGSSELETFFIERRFAEPLGYAGGSTALAALGIWPALMISLRRETPWTLQGAFLGVAVFLAGFVVIAQSRGAVIGTLVAVLILIALAPDRTRLLARLLVAGVALALALGPVLDVYEVALADGDVPGALSDAAGALTLAAAVSALAGVAIGLVERRIRPRDTLVRRARLATLVALGAAVLAGAVLAIANASTIWDDVSDRWDEFESGEEVAVSHGSRLTFGTDPGRYDYWRVAVDAFEGAPIAGIGAGNYELRYTTERREEKHSRYAHNIWLRVLSELGVVGIALFLGFLGAVIGGLVAAYRGLDRATRLVAAAGVATMAYFLVHASFDWVDEFPLLVTAALGLPFIALKAAAPARARSRTRPARRGHLLSAAAILATAGALAAALASFALPYLSLRYVERAADHWPSAPQDAFRDLNRASSLNPLSVQPALTEGTIATELGRDARAESAFRDALDKEDTWYPHFELALLAARQRRFADARRQIATAATLNPHDPIVIEIRGRIRRRERLDPVAVHRDIRAATRQRFHGLRKTP